LTQEYKAKNAGGTNQAVAVYQQAKQIFQSFLDKANGKPDYDGAVKKSKERMQDIDDTINFLQAGGPPSGTPPSGVSSAPDQTTAPDADGGSASAATSPAGPSAASPDGGAVTK
jgi:hypothetical protein